DRLQRSGVAPASEVVPGVLSRHANSFVAGEGHAGESVGAAAGVRACGSGAAGWRAASSVRTSRRLHGAGVTVANSSTTYSSSGRFSDVAPRGSRRHNLFE